MIDRLFKHWNLTRFLYVLIGSAILASGIAEGEWAIGILGAYFAGMGILRIGCAGSSCPTPADSGKSVQNKSETNLGRVSHERD